MDSVDQFRDRLSRGSDIVISVTGGVVTGIFGPPRARVLLLDFDNLKEGDTLLCTTSVDGTPTSEDCLQTIKDAIEIGVKIDKNS